MAEWQGLINQYPLVWLSFMTLLGLGVGSLLNIVVHRLPRMQRHAWMQEIKRLQGKEDQQPETYNLFSPAAACVHCHVRPAFYKQIPLFGWLWLKGKCRHCQQAISHSYPLTELAAALVSLLAALLFPLGWQLVGVLLFSWFLLVLAIIDFQTMQLPDSLTLPLLWLGLLFNLSENYVELTAAVLGAVAGYLSLWLLFWGFKLITGREGLGYGDFKLLAALGAWLGWNVLPVVLTIAAVLGMLLAIGYRNGRHSLNSPIPFGPGLALAGWLLMLYKHADWTRWPIG